MAILASATNIYCFDFSNKALERHAAVLVFTRLKHLQCHRVMMPRNKNFRPEREPFHGDKSFTIKESSTHGPFGGLNPTAAQLDYNTGGSANDFTTTPSTKAEHHTKGHLPAVNCVWTSRNNRKGRHALAVATPETSQDLAPPLLATHPKSILRGIYRMLVTYPVWDISFDVAYVFTIGSIVWIMNGFFSFLPLIRPSTTFPGEVYYGGGITAFIGATVFELGSILLMIEAVNEDRTGCFGWAFVQQAQQYESDISGYIGRRRQFIMPDSTSCTHHHHNMRNSAGQSDDVVQSKGWSWIPSKKALQEHYLYDIGFLACSFQMAGASIFWVAGLTALPGIYNHLSSAALDVVYWTPQVVGGTGFIISGTLFMIETQKRWWQPALGTLGWHIGFWNMLGGVGFTLCPVFGYNTSSWAQYQSSCSTFWGSWAFLIGSVLQWYESLDKFPIVTAPS